MTIPVSCQPKMFKIHFWIFPCYVTWYVGIRDKVPYKKTSFQFETMPPVSNESSLGFLPQPAEYKAQQEHEDGRPDDGRENSKAGEARSPCAKKSVPNPSADQPGNHRAENSSRQTRFPTMALPINPITIATTNETKKLSIMITSHKWFTNQ